MRKPVKTAARGVKASATRTSARRPIKRKPQPNMTRSDFYAIMEEKLPEIDTRTIKEVMVALAEAAGEALSPDGDGVFLVPNVCKLRTKILPAQKGGKKMISPFTGEPTVTKDKPERVKLRAIFVKAVKDAADPVAAKRKERAKARAATTGTTRTARGAKVVRGAGRKPTAQKAVPKRRSHDYDDDF